MSNTTIGIDISKALLDVAMHPQGEVKQFANDTAGHKALIRWLRAQNVFLTAFEATGAYHRLLERALSTAQLPYVRVNPLKARRFAEATGKLAKTDRIDALMLARFAAFLKPTPTKNRRQSVETLSELTVARQALVKDMTALKTRLHTLVSPILKRQANKRLELIQTQIKAIDAQCRKLVARDQELSRCMAILISIPGLGDVTAFVMLAAMPELGTMDKRQVAALAGLAPITRQSGTWQGKSFIRGGRTRVRKALYMPALVAIRFNQQFKAKYQSLTSAGKPAKVAITAIMRKLIIIANALIRDNRNWSENNA
jgi:transposase